EVGQVVCREVYAPDKGRPSVHCDDLAMHAPKKIGAHTKKTWAWIEHMKPYAHLGQAQNEFIRKRVGAIAVDGNVDLHTSLCRFDQHLAQRASHLVVEQYKGF